MESARQLNFWVHDISPFLVQFPDSWIWPLGGNGIRWYGLSYICGFIIGYLLLLWFHRRSRSPYGPAQVSDLATYIIIGVMAGGRLGYMLFYDFAAFIHNPLSVFAIWEGGMASHGGILGVAIAVILFARRQKQSILATGDLIACAAPPGLFLGRVANFLNGELWGKPTTVGWGVIFPEADGLPRHPSQLYEAATEGLLLFVYLQLRFWGKLGPRPRAGQLTGEFLLLYSVLRFICEIFREPDAPLLLGLSRGQFYSVMSVAAGLAFIALACRKPKTTA
jgi:phosphatidylglycerol---prolipoprotein diacylglyceryl transferase